MAKNDDEFDRLLAETERALSPRPAAGSASPAPAPAPAPPRGRFEASIRSSAISGVIAAAIVFPLFWILPFFGPFSGAAGAFVATFVIMLGQRITGHRR